jgi:hypothetical protein
MPKKQRRKSSSDERLVDLLECLGVLGLYLATDMGYHAIARKLGMGTQRVTAILKGVKKPSWQNKNKE